MTSEGKEDYDIESGLYESPGNQEGPKRESIRSAWLEAQGDDGESDAHRGYPMEKGNESTNKDVLGS